MIDGATRFQIFRKVVLPMVKGGVAATAVLCFIFSWTEFLLSLFLTTSIRTLPVKISTFVTSTGTEWGFITGARHVGHRAELHLHPAGAKATGSRPDPWALSRTEAASEPNHQDQQQGRNAMSFKDTTDRPSSSTRARRSTSRTDLASASSCAAWASPASASRPSPPAMLGRRRPVRGLTASSAPTRRRRRTPTMMKWLKDVGKQVQGHQDPLHLRSDAADRSSSTRFKDEFTNGDRHRGRGRDRAARAGARQGDAGRAGPARHLRPLLSRPVLDRDLRAGHASIRASTTTTKPDLAMPGFDWDDFSKPLVDGIAMYDGKMVGIPFDIPIFILMYRKDIFEKHGIKVPTDDGRVHGGGAGDRPRPRRATASSAPTCQAKSGHYSLECDWTACAVGPWRLDLRQGQDVRRQ